MSDHPRPTPAFVREPVDVEEPYALDVLIDRFRRYASMAKFYQPGLPPDFALVHAGDLIAAAELLSDLPRPHPPRINPPLLPWVTFLERRCQARREQVPGRVYWGRCELRRHSEDLDHALERGAEVVRWSTRETEVHPG